MTRNKMVSSDTVRYEVKRKELAINLRGMSVRRKKRFQMF
jgi:hypothetical protein